MKLRFSLSHTRLAANLLAECRFWLLRATDRLDDGDDDRPKLVAAALYTSWLSDELTRLLAAAEAEKVEIAAIFRDGHMPELEDTPRAALLPDVWTMPALPAELDRAHPDLYAVGRLLTKAHSYVSWSRGGRLGDIAASIAENLRSLVLWAPAAGQPAWIPETPSEMDAPPMFMAAHAEFVAEMLAQSRRLLLSAADGLRDWDADKSALVAGAAYAQWLSDCALGDVSRWEGDCSTPRVVAAPLPAGWPFPPVPDALKRDYRELTELRDLLVEVMWVLSRCVTARHGMFPSEHPVNALVVWAKARHDPLDDPSYRW